jgi:iron(III) transport system substrate-binding protein
MFKRPFLSFASLALISTSTWIAPVHAQQSSHQAGAINLYTTREPKLIKPLIEAFTLKTGMQVNTVFLKDGLAERLQAEGQHSPADLLMTADIGQIVDLDEKDALQPTQSVVLNQAIPSQFRSESGTWFALSLRDRVVYASPALKLKEITYEALAEPRLMGKLCIRSGQHPYNIALISAMIAHHGEQYTKNWLKGIKANLARPATGGDRDVARDIAGGICELGVANAYYAAQMKTAVAGSEARKWGDAIEIIQPTFQKTGKTFVNITAAGVARYAPHPAQALAFLEFLVSEEGQALYARADFEHPVRPDVKPDPVIMRFGTFKPDTLPLQTIANHRKQASDLVDQVRFNDK